MHSINTIRSLFFDPCRIHCLFTGTHTCPILLRIRALSFEMSINDKMIGDIGIHAINGRVNK